MNWIEVEHFPLNLDLYALTQFLHERGVAHKIVEDKGQQLLLVVDPAVIPSLKDFLLNYRQGNITLPDAREDNLALEQDAFAVVQNFLATPIVFIIMFLCLLGTLIEGTSWQHYISFQEMLSPYRYRPLLNSLADGEIWRLVTPIFLHFGAVHFIFNMVWLWILGRALERYLNTWGFIAFILLVGVASNLIQYLWVGSANFGGFSGVVYALLGFQLVSQRYDSARLAPMHSGLAAISLISLALGIAGVFDFFIAGRVANAAHLGGLAAGLVYAFVRLAIVGKLTPKP